MWSKETSNDMFDAGIAEDNFVLIANSNKTPCSLMATSWC